MFKNATFKLTISYLCVVMFISIIFSAVVFRVGSDNLTFGLTRETKELQTAFPIFNGTPFAQPNPADLNSGRRHLLDMLILTNIVVLAGAGFVCYILARETLKPIEAAHEQQKRFTADVSHELRTPLTALKMESEVALMDTKMTNKELRKVINSNIEEAGKLNILINNLLRLTRLEAGEIQQQFTKLDLSVVQREAINQLEAAAKNKNILIDSKDKSVNVNGDRDSLIQLAVIFLDNAIKYSSEGSKIETSLSLKGNEPKLTIKDSGTGIASEDLVHIFDRFYRADNARSGGSGFGLGLSIAKLIADLHHADITITSQLNKGTTVTVTFPQPS